MIELIIILIGLFFNLISLKIARIQELDEKLPIPVTDTTHIGVGAFVANLTTSNPLAAIIGFILYITYQILDFIVHKDTIDKDFLTFAIGFFGALGYRQFF
jgi:hypothetical protein